MVVNRWILGVGLILTLVTMMVTPALAEVSKPATVTVNEVVNFTVIDNGAAGINFGSVNSGASNVADAGQTSSVGAVTLTVGAETNVNCMLQVKGAGDFSDGNSHTISLGQAKWHYENMASAAAAMTTTYADVTNSTAGAFSSAEVWHWLSVPSNALSRDLHRELPVSGYTSVETGLSTGGELSPALCSPRRAEMRHRYREDL